ncbi:MAG: alanine racemase [Verrucomicrobia bacterium]|nr:alanine racemase [Verrucomicrobiota bacterium]
MHPLRVERTLQALQELAAAYRRLLPTTIVAITGCYGKTLTKDLLEVLLRQRKRTYASSGSLNSQLGVALSLLEISHLDEIALIEAGVSQVGDMSKLAHMIAPDYALLTTIEGAHLHTMGSLTQTLEEKKLLLQAVPSSGWVIAPQRLSLKNLPSRQIFWDTPSPHLPHADFKEPLFQLTFPEGKTFDLPLKQPVPRQKELLCRALKAAFLLGVESDALIEGLKSYLPQTLYTEMWTSPFGMTFLNDSYCSDPLSIERAFRLFNKAAEGRRLFVFDGFRQEPSRGMRRHLVAALKQHQIDHVLLIDQARSLAKDLQETKITLCADAKEAWNALRQEPQKKATVLLKGARKKGLDQLREEFAEGLSDSRLCLHLDKVEANLNAFRHHLGPQVKICAMVKANGYGTDAIAMAKCLADAGVHLLGVAHLHEAIALRLAGITTDILCLYTAPYEVSQAIEWQVQVAVYDLSLIELLSAEAKRRGRIVPIHLHVDTGMSRLGCRPKETASLALAIERSSSLRLEGVMTHFACADDPAKDAVTRKQFDLFCRLNIQAPLIHAANSAAATRFHLPGCNMVRLGLGLLGLGPCSPTLCLQPAVELSSRIATIQYCQAGETVSYGGTYTVKRAVERIGVIPLGYADGISRAYSNRGQVKVCGQWAPIVGNVCMDFFMCDLTSIPQAQEHTPVLLFGEEPNAEEFAQVGGLTPYELLTRLGSRIQRVFRYEAI